jgi:hypothetical protein
MKLKLGHAEEVNNDERKFGSSKGYIAVHIKRKNANFSLLMTENEFSQMVSRARVNKEDMPKMKKPWYCFW